MTSDNIKGLALSLIKADTEEAVIGVLRKSGYWDDDSAWREYGNDPMNYSTIGNQQSSPDNALVEKLVNSVDAVLMRECLKQGVDPSSSEAPQSIMDAQRKFFDIRDGRLSSIDKNQRSLLRENILLVATGSKTEPSLSIIDKGEGHSPKRIPETILSLTKNNKIRIPFVQGKFGMGGSGVLRFCSRENSVMLVISKRNHEIDKEIDEKAFGEDKTRDLWGVTVVRREDPKGGEKSSHYTYLAPNGEVLSFNADELTILEGNHPKIVHEFIESGTYIKLYEYNIGSGLRSLIMFDLYYRLALLMPDVALPIKMVEHRDYKGDSPETTLAGLSVRLDEDKYENLEPEFQTPGTGTMTVEGQELGYAIYVFKKGKKDNYAGGEGVAFSINGQNHGFLSRTFFARKSVGMSYLSDSILIMIDCSKMSRRKQEKLFMPSRDRLSNEAIRYSIEEELKNIIKKHSGLRELQNRRRNEAIEGRLQDSKPLADVLENIIKKSPTLSDLFLSGRRIPTPFPKPVAPQKFEGEQFPTFFELIKEYTENSPKDCPINQKFQVQFATDAENNYFKRDDAPGELTFELNGEAIQDYSLGLWNGIATMRISLPWGVEIGQTLCFETKVSDISRIKPFTSRFYIHVKDKSKPSDPIPPKPPKSHLDLPNIIYIKEEDWAKDYYRGFGFGQFSALKVREKEGVYDFYINVDNIYLKNEMKSDTKTDSKILEARYSYGMVLLGMSLLNFEGKRNKKGEASESGDPNNSGLPVEDQISKLTEAMSPILLPMIAYLGSEELDS